MAFDVEDENDTASTSVASVAAPPPPLTEEQKVALAAERERKYLEVVALAQSIIAKKEATTGILTVVTYESTCELMTGLREAAETAASSAEDVREVRKTEITSLLAEIEPAWSMLHYVHELKVQATKAGVSDVTNINVNDLPQRIASAASEEMLKQIDSHLNGLVLTGEAARKHQAVGHAIYAAAIGEMEAKRLRIEGLRKELAENLSQAAALDPYLWKNADLDAVKRIFAVLNRIAYGAPELTPDEHAQAAKAVGRTAKVYDELVCRHKLQAYTLVQLADEKRIVPITDAVLTEIATGLLALTASDFLLVETFQQVGPAMTAVKAEADRRVAANTPAPVPTPAPAASTTSPAPAKGWGQKLEDWWNRPTDWPAHGSQLAIIALFAGAIGLVAYLVSNGETSAAEDHPRASIVDTRPLYAPGDMCSAADITAGYVPCPGHDPAAGVCIVQACDHTTGRAGVCASIPGCSYPDPLPAPVVRDLSGYPNTLVIPTRGDHACITAPDHDVCDDGAERDLPEGAVWYCPGMRRYTDIACAPLAGCNYCIPGCHVCLPR